MKVSSNKVVELSYKLKLDGFEGELIEEMTSSKPFVFLYGGDSMLKSFEENIEGLAKGDNFKFSIDYLNAYGEIDNENIISMDKNIFEIDGKIDEELIFIGAVVPMKDENGNDYEGMIAEIKKDKIVVDFNHPLAGEDLFFEGKILSVREATKEEIEAGYIPMDDENE